MRGEREALRMRNGSCQTDLKRLPNCHCATAPLRHSATVPHGLVAAYRPSGFPIEIQAFQPAQMRRSGQGRPTDAGDGIAAQIQRA
jgi:hypothetical protein